MGRIEVDAIQCGDKVGRIEAMSSGILLLYPAHFLHEFIYYAFISKHTFLTSKNTSYVKFFAIFF